MPKKLWNKPLPAVDQDDVLFWEGLKRHEFMLWHCKECGAWYWPKSYCRNHSLNNRPFCGKMEWAKASGKGKVFCFNIAYRAMHQAFKDDIPYVYAIIKTDEGPNIGSNVIGCDPKDVYIGMPVEVVFEDVTKAEYSNIVWEFTLPKFRPVG